MLRPGPESGGDQLDRGRAMSGFLGTTLEIGGRELQAMEPVRNSIDLGLLPVVGGTGQRQLNVVQFEGGGRPGDNQGQGLDRLDR